MPHEFEVREEITLEATPEQVWEAIATGPGIDSWFMGRNEVEPREGGRTRLAMGGYTQESTVTAWEPRKRFAFRGDENPDGTFMAFEYLIEGREAGSTVLRFVHNGFLGDDWEEQYDALRTGDFMYLRKLATYLKYFPGRTAAFSLLIPGPQVADAERVWAAFTGAAGLPGTVTEGDHGRLSVEGLAAAEGVVRIAAPGTALGIVTGDSLYVFIHGYRDAVVVEQHGFSAGLDAGAAERAWQAWLARTFA